jgi:hypothetical protein
MKKWKDIIVFFIYFYIIKVGFTRFYDIFKIRLRVIADINLFSNRSLAFIPIFIISFLFTMYIMDYRPNSDIFYKNKLPLLKK